MTHVPTILVAGTSMNAGKTTTVASLVHGLTPAGLRVGAGRFTGTGTGASGDRYPSADADAPKVLDCTDMGHVSTYRVPIERLAQVAAWMHDTLAAGGVDVIVLEIADGVLHSVADRVVAVGDAAGALLGVAQMRKCGQWFLAVSGLLTASPLATREARTWLDAPVYGTPDLCDAALATALLKRATGGAVDTAPTRAALAVAGK